MSGKKIGIGVAVVAVPAAAALLWLGSSLNGLVKAGVERYGPRMTETEVRLAGVDLNLREGRGTLRRLEIRNPEGFSGGNAVALGEITLDVDTETLTREPLVIDTLRIAGPELLLEVAEGGRVNLRSLQKSVEKYVPARRSGAGGSDPKPPLRVAVRTLTIEGGKLRLDTRAIGGERSERELGSFTLRDLGGKDGVPADELGREVLRTMLVRTLRGSAVDELERKAGEKLKEAEGFLKGLAS